MKTEIEWNFFVDAETMTVNPVMTTNPLGHFYGITTYKFDT